MNKDVFLALVGLPGTRLSFSDNLDQTVVSVTFSVTASVAVDNILMMEDGADEQWRQIAEGMREKILEKLREVV